MTPENASNLDEIVSPFLKFIIPVQSISRCHVILGEVTQLTWCHFDPRYLTNGLSILASETARPNKQTVAMEKAGGFKL